MCGRFTLRAPASVIAEQFAVFELPPFAPRYNIAPSQPVAVVPEDFRVMILDDDVAAAEPVQLLGVERDRPVAHVAMRIEHLGSPGDARTALYDLVDLALPAGPQ